MLSCSSEPSGNSEFYTSKKEFDLWRFPLLPPYELVSPNNDSDWFLILQDPKIIGHDFILNETEFQFTSITQIGIIDSIIVIENTDQYWPKLSGMYPSILMIDAKSNTCFIYSREHHLEEIVRKKNELNIENIKLHPWSEVREDYQKFGKLPENWKK